MKQRPYLPFLTFPLKRLLNNETAAAFEAERAIRNLTK
jgi:hypothetical protein